MKNKFIKSTIILIIGGFITKILGSIIKISLTRVIKTEGIGTYSLILPTFNLFITLCSLGLPIAISKLISENKISGKKIVLPAIPLILLFNILLIIILIIISPIISNNLLHNNNTYLPLIAIGFTLPFISISSILKGYYFGKEQMFPATISNIIEQIIRLILTIIIIPHLMKYTLKIAITGVVLINIISEFISIITLLFFIPKHTKIKIEDFKQNKKITKDLLDISLPSTGSRLIGSLSYFLEPIILTYVLTKVGYTTNYITIEYGIINGYIYPLLLLPSFFTLAISNALLPVVSNTYSNKNYTYTKYKIKQAITLSLIIGVPCTLLFMTIPEIFLKLIYNTQEGINYIKIISPFFLLYYIQAPLTSSMQAMNKANEAMIGTLIGAIIKTILLLILSYLKIGIWGLIISNLVNIIFITIHHFYYVFIKNN
ncbi:MAG: oligosaccharide flippase family protein [Bacilli bacterium]|nr:oligosaccharide flippase family protein [Bacilli bacterium]